MTLNVLAFSLFNSRSHRSAFDHEGHLVSWVRIKFCDKFCDVGIVKDYVLVPARSFQLVFHQLCKPVQTEMAAYLPTNNISLEN